MTIAACGLIALAGCSTPEEAAEAEAPTTTEVDRVATSFASRMDSERSDPGQFQLTEGENELRVLTGPAGIAYDSTMSIDRGDFHVEATFSQYGAPVGYREAYGIFVGGRELEAPDLEYTYLLVRPTGDILIKRRVGEITETIVDWTPHEAVVQVVAEGDEPTNTLAIDVILGEARFMVNGILVHSMPAAEARPYGVTGLRVNHRLDVRVTDMRLHATLEETD